MNKRIWADILALIILSMIASLFITYVTHVPKQQPMEQTTDGTNNTNTDQDPSPR